MISNETRPLNNVGNSHAHSFLYLFAFKAQLNKISFARVAISKINPILIIEFLIAKNGIRFNLVSHMYVRARSLYSIHWFSCLFWKINFLTFSLFSWQLVVWFGICALHGCPDLILFLVKQQRTHDFVKNVNKTVNKKALNVARTQNNQ